MLSRASSGQETFYQLISQGQQRGPRGHCLLYVCKLSSGSKSKLLFFSSLRQTYCLIQSKTEQYFINCHHFLHCWRMKAKSQPLRKRQHGVPTHKHPHPPLHQHFLKTRLDSCFSVSHVSNFLLPTSLAKDCL